MILVEKFKTLIHGQHTSVKTGAQETCDSGVPNAAGRQSPSTDISFSRFFALLSANNESGRVYDGWLAQQHRSSNVILRQWLRIDPLPNMPWHEAKRIISTLSEVYDMGFSPARKNNRNNYRHIKSKVLQELRSNSNLPSLSLQ